MSDDLISRQAAIEAIRNSAKKYTGFMEMELYTDDDAVKALKSMHSVQLRGKGRWYFADDGYLRCSGCKQKAPYYGDECTATNYCPRCGAKMEDNENE